MNLTTAERYFTLFTEAVQLASKPTEIARINMRIASVSASVERYLNRTIKTDVYTDKFTPDNGSGTKSVQLKAFPIVSVNSVTSFGEDVDQDDYQYDSELGVLAFRNSIIRIDSLFEKQIIVEYSGGMAEDTADFILKYPDIEIEVLTQINFEIKRIGDIAMKTVANGQTSSQLNPYGFMDSLITVLDRYRRVIGP